MADLEIPEGELTALARQLDGLAETTDGLDGIAAALATAAAAMPGGRCAGTAARAGDAVELRVSQFSGRVRASSADIADLDGEFSSLDAYYEQEFGSVPPGGQYPA